MVRALFLRVEQLGIPEDVEVTDRTTARVWDMPDDLVEEYARNAFSTPYRLSHTLEEDDDIDVYKPEHEPEAEEEEESPVHVSEPMVPVSVSAVEESVVR